MKWSEIVASWASDPANKDLNDLTSDFANYAAYPVQVYNILQSRGRDLAGSVAYWYAVKHLGFDPDAIKDREDQGAGQSAAGQSGAVISSGKA